MKKINIAPQDTLTGKFNTLRTGVKSNLMDVLGKDLYSILETKEVKRDAPFGFKSTFNLEDKSLNFRKNFGKDWQFDFDVTKPKSWDVRMNLKKEF